MVTISDPLTQEIVEELRRLPVSGRRQVLDFVRFLAFRPSNRQELEREFDRAVESMRTLAMEQKISDADIDAEIAQIRGQR